MPIARYVLQGSHTGTGILVVQNPALRWLRDHVLLPLLSLDSIQQYLAQQASELNMHYRRSSLSRSSYENKVNVSEQLSWRRAPHAGDRALPGDCLSYPSHEQTNLYQVFRGTESHLLLFAGLAPAGKEYAHLAWLAANVETLTGGCVKAHIVVVGSEKPAHLTWHGSILLDPQGKLHALYGARRQSLYFIRPDGYIGLRSQPASEEQLLGYLGKIFSL